LRLWHRFKGDLTACIENCLVDEFEEGLIGSQLSRTIVMVKWHVVFRQSLINAHKRIVAGHITELLSEKDSSECAKPELDEWLHTKLYKFAQSLFPEEGFKENTWQELRLIAISNLAEARSQQLFEMVTEYPDSIPGLKELGECAKQANSVAAIGKRFRISLQKRLLHMGASTSQILDFYVSMIKALRLLDPSDTLLSYVAVPVRKYLLTRKDAVRCIVASLTEGKESELHGELKQGGNLAYAADEDDEENGPGAHWEPNKRNKELVQPSAEGASKGLDTLAMLVSIYGSTDLFIVEFRSLLADKLISNVTYATDNEVANLELLKIRSVYNLMLCNYFLILSS
jgi:anaphase-promoting complex subunit 2